MRASHPTLESLRRVTQSLGRSVRVFMADAEPRRLRSAGPRVVHRASGIRFCWVPPSRVAPGFLLAEDVLVWADARALGLLARTRKRVVTGDATDDDDMPLYLAPDELAVVLTHFELPSGMMWEWAYRAGTETRFPWGDRPPTAPPAWPHPLGLTRMAWYDELVEPAAPALRGGAARSWPWHEDADPDTSWERLRPDFQRAWDGREPFAFRPVLPLGPA